jgi:hypothetical protein
MKQINVTAGKRHVSGGSRLVHGVTRGLERHGRNKEDCRVEPCGRWLGALFTQYWQQLIRPTHKYTRDRADVLWLYPQVVHEDGLHTVEDVCITSLSLWMMREKEVWPNVCF